MNEKGRKRKAWRRGVEAREKIAWTMYLAGNSYEQMVEACGFKSKASAYAAIQRILAKHPDPDIDSWRRTQTSRYEDLLQKLAPKLKAQDPNAIAEARQLLARLDRIHNLEAVPTVGLVPGQGIKVEIVRENKREDKATD